MSFTNEKDYFRTRTGRSFAAKESGSPDHVRLNAARYAPARHGPASTKRNLGAHGGSLSHTKATPLGRERVPGVPYVVRLASGDLIVVPGVPSLEGLPLPAGKVAYERKIHDELSIAVAQRKATPTPSEDPARGRSATHDWWRPSALIQTALAAAGKSTYNILRYARESGPDRSSWAGAGEADHAAIQIVASMDTFERNSLRAALSSIKPLKHPPEQGDVADGLSLRPLDPAERASFTFRALGRSFDLRRRELDQSVSAVEVARLLDRSPADVEAARRDDALIAIEASAGEWLYPAWQFDADAPGGHLRGLVSAWQAIDSHRPLTKIAWLTTSKQYFDGRTPVQVLRDGNLDSVLVHARGAHVS